MNTLLSEQAEALRELQETCDMLGIDIVIIGAAALRVWLPDVHRVTEDVDVAVALDLDEFSLLTARFSMRPRCVRRTWEICC
jgi:hypothetical protein